MRISVILSLLFFFSASASAQNRFDSARLLTNLKTLSLDDYEGREAGSPGGIRAGDYLAEVFSEVGLEACGSDYKHPFSFIGRNESTYNGTNVLGLITGIQNPDQYLVVTAHYDHVGIRNGEIYNGSDDNASGTVTLVAVAEYFLSHPPLHSIVIAAVDAEEKGLRGAAEFVRNPCVPGDGISMNVNIDMISRSESRELYVAGTSHYPELFPLLNGLAQDRTLRVLFGHDTAGTGSNDWTFSSDHAPFHRAGIPFVYFGVEDHPDYHKASDEFEFVDAAFFIDAVDVILDAILLLDENLEAIRLINER